MPTSYQPGQSIDHNEIIRLLGRGGASRVYLARDRRSLQEVVLKVPLDDVIGGKAIFERYRREAEIGKCLTHPFRAIFRRNPTLPASLATVVMRAIRRDPKKRSASMQELLYDLCHLDKVVPLDYFPDPPLLGGRYRQALLISLLVFVVCLGLIAFGMLAQFAHHAVR